MEWVREFYDNQGQWSGCYREDISDENRQKAGLIEQVMGPGSKRVLELGAGGGQAAAAAADLGHRVTAIDLVPANCAHARQLAAARPDEGLIVIEGDFYTEPIEGPFDVVCYWDGFGIGLDADQQRLLERVAGWLAPNGRALIEISTPWYAASVDGRGWEVGEAERRYTFDADGCRWLDTWWPKGRPDQAVQQSLRCYSPADLRLLLQPTGLDLHGVTPGGTVDWEQGRWLPSVPLERAMKYVAELRVG